MKSLLVVVWLVIIGLASCEKKYENITVEELLRERNHLIESYNDTINSLKYHVDGLTNTQQAQSYHISKLYERIDSMHRKLMKMQDSITFNAPTDWSSSISSPEDAGPYTPTEKDSVEWGLRDGSKVKTVWIKP